MESEFRRALNTAAARSWTSRQLIVQWFFRERMGYLLVLTYEWFKL